MSIENKRDSKYKKQIDQRKKIMDDLRDTGPSVYHNYSTTAQEMLKHKSDALRAAEEEEEKVRLVRIRIVYSLGYLLLKRYHPALPLAVYLTN